MELGASLELWRALEEVSSKLTELAGRACQELGLNPDVSVLVSLERFCEDWECGRDADYLVKPLVSRVIFKFPKPGKRRDIFNIVEAHQFIQKYISRHIWPRYVPHSRIRRKIKKMIRRSKGEIVIHFPSF
jgi:hypothetical protein